MIPEVTCEELAKELASTDPPVVLDVREGHELENSRLDPHILIPLADLPDRINELDPAVPMVVVCRTGNRSGTAAMFLLRQGFGSVRNLAGGMNAWVERIDPTMRKY
jgi:adenylyltransferase/sulfurtransferase